MTPRECPLRALTMYDHVPGGCILQQVTDDDSAPHLRAGEFAIVDTTDTWPPQHGSLCAAISAAPLAEAG